MKILKNNFFEIDKSIIELSEKALEMCKEPFRKIDDIQEYNQLKMIKAEKFLTRSIRMYLMQRMLWCVIIL